MRKQFIIAGTAVAMLVAPSIASASVTYDPATGTGFVGKGDVQSAYGINNGTLQDALKKDPQAVKFKYNQPAQQTVSENASQVGTQSVETTIRRHVECIVVTGGIKNRVEHDRYGARYGIRFGTRSGSREGIRSGTISGSVLSTINGDPRQVKGQNQFTGFNLTGKSAGTFTPQGDINWGDTTFGEFEFSAPVMSDIEWGGWGENSDPTENPASCLSGNSNVEDLVDTTTESAPAFGDTVLGSIDYSNRTYGETTVTGLGSMLASFNGSDFRTIWPTIVTA